MYGINFGITDGMNTVGQVPTKRSPMLYVVFLFVLKGISNFHAACVNPDVAPFTLSDRDLSCLHFFLFIFSFL